MTEDENGVVQILDAKTKEDRTSLESLLSRSGVKNTNNKRSSQDSMSSFEHKNTLGDNEDKFKNNEDKENMDINKQRANQRNVKSAQKQLKAIRAMTVIQEANK